MRRTLLFSLHEEQHDDGRRTVVALGDAGQMLASGPAQRAHGVTADALAVLGDRPPNGETTRTAR